MTRPRLTPFCHVWTYPVADIVPYINWLYFFHAWGFEPRFAAIADIHACEACRTSWLSTFPETDKAKAGQALQLYKEAGHMLRTLQDRITASTLFRLCNANAEGDNLLLDNITLPLLRQQTKHGKNDYCLCLSDFIRPLSSGINDQVGVFAASVHTAAMEQEYTNDPYNHLLIQTLADRLAEAAVEKMHEHVRKTTWGYAPHEQLSMKDLHLEKFQGIRPATGYPSLPDQSVNTIIDTLLNLKQINITLTENGAMHPHSSVCGLMFAHPAARYFSVGKPGQDQLADYAARRGKTVEEMRKYIVT